MGAHGYAGAAAHGDELSFGYGEEAGKGERLNHRSLSRSGESKG